MLLTPVDSNTQIVLALVFVSIAGFVVSWFWGKAYADKKTADARAELEKKFAAMELKISTSAATKVRDILSRPKPDHNVHSIDEFLSRVKKKDDSNNGNNGNSA